MALIIAKGRSRHLRQQI